MGQAGEVRFPEEDGARSTTATGRAIAAAAALAVDPALAERIRAPGDWRKDYLAALRALAAPAPQDGAPGSRRGALEAVARAGLRALHERLLLGDAPLAAGIPAAPAPATERVAGRADPVAELVVPYRGRELRGDALRAQLADWTARGVLERAGAAAIAAVIDHPEWLPVAGRRVAVLGAGAELGPLAPLLAWGADVLAVDVPSPPLWRRVLAAARAGAGTLALPVAVNGGSSASGDAGPARERSAPADAVPARERSAPADAVPARERSAPADAVPAHERSEAGDAGRADRAGLDLTRDLPAVRAWLLDAAGDAPLVVGTYAYAPGGDHVRVSAAADALVADLLATRPQTAFACLATPTDAFLVTPEIADAARARWSRRGALALAQRPLAALSGGRLFRPAYAGDGPPVADALVPQQGPNYALAKRVQRWRALVARADGHLVSCNVAPASMTRSVTSSSVLAAAFGGAARFGVEAFAPATTRVLMAALLVHDLHRPPPAGDEAHLVAHAAHGGLWRTAYEPRSALGFAALAGLPAAVRARVGR